MTDVIITQLPGGEVVTTATGTSIVISTVEAGLQGPPGPQGDPGEVVGAEMFLAKAARLSEFDSEDAKAAARTNIGLQYIDGGTFN